MLEHPHFPVSSTIYSQSARIGPNVIVPEVTIPIPYYNYTVFPGLQGHALGCGLILEVYKGVDKINVKQKWSNKEALRV